MMMPNEESSRLLHDIEEISKALFSHDVPPKPPIPAKHVKDDLLLNGKRSSILKWKPLKSLRNHRVSCSFFLHVHSIEGLPLNFNNLNLRVYWKRKHEVLKSQSIRVKEGVAMFEETLIHRSSVYVSKHDLHDDVATYTPKLFLLYASVVGAPSLNIGKHQVDLTRLLPLTLTELEDEQNRSGKWITSFKLMGKAKGATINVSFGFSLMGDKFTKSGNPGKGKSQNVMLQRVESVPSNPRRRTRLSNLSLDLKPPTGILPSLDLKSPTGILPYDGPSVGLRPSFGLLYELLDDAKTSNSKELSSFSNDVDNDDDDDDDEFRVVDKGIEFTKSVENSCIETINVAELFGDEVNDDIVSEPEESNEELELFLQNLSISEKPELDVSFNENEFLENVYNMKNEASCEGGKMLKSRSLDDLTNTVVHDFMNLVSFDGEPEPESPRERLLKQFEKETLASGNLVFDFDVNDDQNDCSNIFDSSFLFQKAEREHDHQADAVPTLICRRKAKMIENLETETLMEKWGLNESAFQNSPRTDSGAFGSPVFLSPKKQHELSSLGDGLGPFLKTENGGFLRSMNPLLFKRAKNGEKLVLQASNTIVLSPAMGSNGMDILVNWATLGPEKMLSQVTRLMPLEVVTGKTLQQAAWNAESSMAVFEREDNLLNESETIDSEYASWSSVIPLTIEKIEHLLLEGLRIQSGISTEVPPSTIISASTSRTEIEELAEMSIPLDDWITFNKSTNSNLQPAVNDPCFNNPGKSFDINCEYFSNLTLALQILLRDPFRDYEPVGIPMLALLQLEKSMNADQMVKVKEVHITGMKANLRKKQQSGSRWLHSSGMTGNAKRFPLSKSTALVKSSIRLMNMRHEETLWSISKESSGQNLYVRNADIVFR